MRRPLLLGHRGCRLSTGGAPGENTLAAFELCMQTGCDGFEFDVRLTADRQLIICHDPRLKGKLVAHSEYESFSTGQSATCCLKDVLARYGDAAFLDIELKVQGSEDLVAAAARACTFKRGFVISSFLPEVLSRLHAIDSTLPLGHIFDRIRDTQRWRDLPVSYVMPQHKLVSREMIRELHGEGKQVVTWTVNARRDMECLAEWGVDAIVSDDPALLCSVLGGSGR